MRLVRIETTDGVAVALHPQLTVVGGVTGAARQRLIDALGGVASGQVLGITGLVEAQGVQFDLAPDALALLEVTSGLDAVVRADQLPGQDRDLLRATARRREAEVDLEALSARLAEARRHLADAEDARTQAADALDAHLALEAERSAHPDPAAERARAQAALAAAEQVQEAANAALSAAIERRNQLLTSHAGPSVAEARLAAAQQRCDDASARVAEAVATIERTRSGLDPQAEAALADAQADVAHLAALGPGPGSDEVLDAPRSGPDPDAEQRPDSLEHTQLRLRRDEVRQALAALAGADPSRVAAALAAASGASGADGPPPAAASLALRWEQVETRLAALDPDDIDPEEAHAHALSSARLRVAQARMALDEARGGGTSGTFDPEVIERLERAHHMVLSTQERSEGRFARGKSRKQLEEARATEQLILDELGFTTYAEFMMSAAPSAGAPPETSTADATEAWEAAVADLAALEDAGPGATGAPEVDETTLARREELHNEREALRQEAAGLLGREPSDDVAADLRDLRGPVQDLDADAPDLGEALVEVGLVVDDADFHPDTLVALAQVWLAEQREAPARRQALEAELAAIDAELTALGDAPDTGAEPASEGQLGQDPLLTAAQAAAAAAQERLDRHRQAESDVAEAEVALALAADEAEAAEAELAEATAEAAEAAGTDVASALSAATDDVEAANVARALATAEVAEALSALDALPQVEEPVETPPDPRPALEAAVSQVTVAVGAASAQVRGLEVEAEGMERRIRELRSAEQSASAKRTASKAERAARVEEIEWYLLSRLADQRQASLAGSLPLVLDDPFTGLSSDETTAVVGAIERLAGAVQVIVISDDAGLAGWASSLDPTRASVVTAV